MIYSFQREWRQGNTWLKGLIEAHVFKRRSEMLDMIKRDLDNLPVGQNYPYLIKTTGKMLSEDEAHVASFMQRMFDEGRLIPLKRVISRTAYEISTFECIAQKSKSYDV